MKNSPGLFHAKSPFYSDMRYFLVERFRTGTGVTTRTVGEFESEFMACMAMQACEKRPRGGSMEIVWVYSGFGEGEYNYE